ncbi:uncharacterized protein LOC128675136 [Plodia interpunctella]|uniref:uncharacterized protein LOC128675136 n=1 Tax=Plodia interpunctella TaxID=58824 RepID=UPI002367A7C9|nr:uncharacterized protein LOC128675136 [Plodia interpunctella]
MDSGRLEAVPNGTVHLDTVRALHQTVVSLRTALEVSKNELRALKQKYEQHSQCTEYADVIQKLTIENHILRRKIIDSGCEDRESPAQNIKLQVTYSPRPQSSLDRSIGDEVVIQTATTDVKGSVEAEVPVEEEESPVDTETEEPLNEIEIFCSTDNLNQPEVSFAEIVPSPEVDVSAEISPHNNTEIEEIHSQITTYPKESIDTRQPSFKTKLELLSKFDVRIKVKSAKEGVIISSTTSESGSTATDENKGKEDKDKAKFEFEERREHFENTEGVGGKVNLKSVATESIKMAVPNESEAKNKVDKFNVQVRITSEENLVVKENVERSRRKDTLNLDVDDLSLRSLSEGDNSVFSEGGATPMNPAAEDKCDPEAGSGNESEEVDDIELIFTTDESKDMSNLQEDLVSIRETDHWTPVTTSTTHSTPVLIKFHTLDPDFQPGGETSENAENENQENRSLQLTESLKKRVSLPSDKDIRHVAFNGKSLDLPGRGILKSCDNKSDNMLYKRSPNTSTKRLDSVDSLTCEYNRGLSFDNTKSSSFELGSSMDILHRDESIDNFHKTHHLGHRFSVFAESDISKCGISEEDLTGNLNVRRNTCPNPFQYRAPLLIGPSRGVPLKPAPRRPAAAPRRDSAAQTLLSALPPRWSSEGYLAHKIPLTSGAPTLPQRVTAAPSVNTAASRRLTVPNARRPPVLAEDERRVLLSDIGFTSMVPELSRSADPVWALAKRPSQTDSPISNSTSKFLSRGSSCRSPSASVDRSYDWTPHAGYTPHTRLDYRPWRNSLPDVRRDDTEELLWEAERFVRGSIENLRATSLDLEAAPGSPGGVGSRALIAGGSQPYIPSEPRQLRLGHTVKLISPQGRVLVGRVRYVGLAGSSAATSSVVVGAECASAGAGRGRNDGTHRGRRYFLAAPHCTALFVPFNKIVMAWPN